jgi:hypothetical protein
MLTRPLLSATVLLSLASGCANDELGSMEEDLSVETTKLPTLLETVKAGDPFFPLLDQQPLQLGGLGSGGEGPEEGTEGCIVKPKIRVSSMKTELTGSVVTSRVDMSRKLELSAEGVPISVQAISATVSGKLLQQTSFSQGATNLLFQVVGRYSTEIAGAAMVHKFSPEAIERCGYGYVRKAEHRVSALVVVTIESATRDNTLDIELGGAVTPAAAKASFSRKLRTGQFNITIRSVTEGLEQDGSQRGQPDLAVPFGGLALLSSTPEEPQKAEEGIAKALDWLGNVQREMVSPEVTGEVLRTAPVTAVHFKYYPQTPASLRADLSKAFDGLNKIRTVRQANLTRLANWGDVEAAFAAGRGHEFNIKNAPVAKVDALAERMREATGAEGPLAKHEEIAAAAEEACAGAIMNRDASTDLTQVGAAMHVCANIPSGVGFEKFEVSPLRLTRVAKERFADTNCPANSRRPSDNELKLLAPYSEATGDLGIWIDSPTSRYEWFLKGKKDSMLLNTTGIALCVPTALGIL